MRKHKKKEKIMKKQRGITIIALIITILFSYDYDRNSNKFLLSIHY